MTEQPNLLDLQKQQREHDRDHHHDIHTLPYPDRMNHYVLHFSKYVGRLSQDYSDAESRNDHLKKTFADTFIVALAAANTLNLDLHAEVEERVGHKTGNIKDLSLERDNHDNPTEEGIQTWWFNQLSAPTGRMANALESLDHMEPVNVRKELEDGTIEIIEELLVVSEILHIDLKEVVRERWNEIEKESIL